MSEPNPTQPTPDDSLADFADRVLAGKTSAPDSSSDTELRGLEETILRLQQTLPQGDPDEKTLRHLQANFRARVRKADSPTIPAWQFLRPRRNMALAFAAILAILVIALPFLPIDNGPLPGTAGRQAQDILLLAGIACVAILLIWARRRK